MNVTTIVGQADGTGDTDLNHLNMSSNVYINSNGDLYVSDRYNHRVLLLAYNTQRSTTFAVHGMYSFVGLVRHCFLSFLGTASNTQSSNALSDGMNVR